MISDNSILRNKQEYYEKLLKNYYLSIVIVNLSSFNYFNYAH